MGRAIIRLSFGRTTKQIGVASRRALHPAFGDAGDRAVLEDRAAA